MPAYKVTAIKMSGNKYNFLRHDPHIRESAQLLLDGGKFSGCQLTGTTFLTRETGPGANHFNIIVKLPGAPERVVGKVHFESIGGI